MQPGTAHAAYNPEINYQGKLANASNVAVADGQYPIIFSLYSAATGGSAVWTETDYGVNQVTVKNGLFSIMLGSTTPFTGIDFNQTYYLGVTVASDTEMTPRKIIGAVPAAFYAATSTYATTSGTSTNALSAATLNGITPGQFFRNDQQNSTSSASTFLNVLQTGAGKVAEFFGSASQSVLAILSNGNVGIGSSTPSTALVVSGTVTIGNLVSTTTTASTFAGGLSVSGATTLATSLTGFIQATSGVISATTSPSLNAMSGVLGVANGGTGQSTYTDGQLLIGNTLTNGLTPANLTGTSNEISVTNGHGSITLSTPQAIGTGSSPTFASTTLSNFTAGSVVFAGTGGALNQNNSNLFWDNTNGRLGIGTVSPSQKLDVAGNVNVSAGSAYMYNGQNVITASTTLNDYFFGGAGNNTMTGGYNTGEGLSALASNTSGVFNVANGYYALYTNTTGFSNTANGLYSLYYNSSGSNNTGNGADALLHNDTGSNNTGNGVNTLHFNNAGSNNTALGYQSAYNLTGSSNIAIGYNVDLPSNSGNQQLNIGNLIYGVGVSSTTNPSSVPSGGFVGIGTTVPLNKLDIAGASAIGSDYAGAYTAPTNGEIIEGNVGIGTTSPSNRLEVSGNTFLGGNLTATGTLKVSGIATLGGLNLASLGANILTALDSSGNLVGTSSPSVAFINATSTTATSTFAGGLSVAGSTGLNVLQNGSVGIGTNLLSGAKFKVTLTSSSVSDNYTDQSKIAANSNITVSSGLSLASTVCGSYSVTGQDGLTYGTVVGADGKCWLDRNLGATRVATSKTDTSGYGSLYQWGRLYDGHQVPTSGTTGTQSTGDVPGNSNFIIGYSDWRSTQNDNLWQGVSGVNNPCPTGFRLPTQPEFATLVTDAGITNDDTAYSSTLKLPLAGLRDNGGGGLSIRVSTATTGRVVRPPRTPTI